MERLTLTWTRPDGAIASEVVFTYATPELAAAAMGDALDALGKPGHLKIRAEDR